MTNTLNRAFVASLASASLLAGPAVLAQAAPTPTPTPAPTPSVAASATPSQAEATVRAAAPAPVVAKPGDRNNTVKQIQGRLNGLGYLPVSAIIGNYGPQTTAAVKKFQAAYKLPVTGIVDSTTNARIITAYRNRKPAPKPTPKPATSIVAKPGDRNNTVKQIQGRLSGLGYLPVSAIIGNYGPQTTAAVKKFQKDNRLPVTGIVDSRTNTWIINKYKNRKAAKPAPKPAAGVVAKAGDRNNTVKQIQGRLSGLGYLPTSAIIGIYGPQTTAAVKQFQKDNRLPVTGIVDSRTNTWIINKYKNRKPATGAAAKLDRRCLTGRALCVDKGDHRMYWVINGKVQKSYDVRTGRPGHATRNGSFKVYLKHPNWYSTLYHVNMPYTMFFDGGEAVHYSAEFARIGHSGPGSHGCVNMNKLSDARWLYSQVRVGDKVIVTP